MKTPPETGGTLLHSGAADMSRTSLAEIIKRRSPRPADVEAEFNSSV